MLAPQVAIISLLPPKSRHRAELPGTQTPGTQTPGQGVRNAAWGHTALLFPQGKITRLAAKQEGPPQRETLTSPSPQKGRGTEPHSSLTPLAHTLTGKMQPKSHLFSKVDNVNVDLLLLQTLCQLHQLQQRDTAALASYCPHLSSHNPSPPFGNRGTALRIQKQSPRSAAQLQPTLSLLGHSLPPRAGQGPSHPSGLGARGEQKQHFLLGLVLLTSFSLSSTGLPTKAMIRIL